MASISSAEVTHMLKNGLAKLEKGRLILLGPDGKPKAKPSKYKNQITEVDGIKFHSRAEANYYCHLKRMMNAKEPSDQVAKFECQVSYVVCPEQRDVEGKVVEKQVLYVADFVVDYADGRREVVDVKGMITPLYELKRKLMLKNYGIKIVEVGVAKPTAAKKKSGRTV